MEKSKMIGYLLCRAREYYRVGWESAMGFEGWGSGNFKGGNAKKHTEHNTNQAEPDKIELSN
jgi:hypothetical protein